MKVIKLSQKNKGYHIILYAYQYFFETVPVSISKSNPNSNFFHQINIRDSADR